MPDDLWKTSPALAIAKNLMQGTPVFDRQPEDPSDFIAASSSHSIPRRLKTRPGSIARNLLGHDPVPLPTDATRPLIDLVQEASFQEAPGLSSVSDHRAFRELLRKAACFTLDKDTSGMVGDLSIAVAQDLNTARQMAIPPFPVTWFEFNNKARLDRMVERGCSLTPTAAGLTEAGPPVERAGWLVSPDSGRGYFAHYFTVVDEGVLMAPMAFAWLLGMEIYDYPEELGMNNPERQAYINRICFGMEDSRAIPCTFTLGIARWQRSLPSVALEYMEELAGELRHIFGLLTALSAGHAGLTMATRPQAKPQGPSPRMPSGKEIFPLEHKHLHLHLGKRQTVDRVMLKIIRHHRARFHDVRAHMRKLASGRLVPVRSHTRGDKALGVITKDYLVER